MSKAGDGIARLPSPALDSQVQTDTEVKHCLSLFLSQNPAAGGNPPQSLDLKVQEECLTIPSPAQPIFLGNSRTKMGLSQPFFPFLRNHQFMGDLHAPGHLSPSLSLLSQGDIPTTFRWPQASFMDTCCRASLNHSMASDERDLKDHPDPNHLPCQGNLSPVKVSQSPI